MLLADWARQTLLDVGSLVKRRTYRTWVRQWEFWAVLGLAAVLRLIAIPHAPFGSDPALSFLEVARSSHDHTLPVTGEYNSILALELPAYSFIILPFANHPFGVAVLTALANTAAVGLVYILGERYFGRKVALVASLLTATALYDTWMSEFLWPPTLTIPVTMAALYFLYRGAVARKRFWLGPHLILLAIAMQLHPITASLIPVTAVGIVLGWSALSVVDVALGALGSFVLFLPTIIFEHVSGGIDIPAYQQWLALPKVLDGQVFASLIESLGPRPAEYFGPTPYVQVQPWFLWLKGCVGGLWLVATVWLIVYISLPIVRHIGEHGVRNIRGLLGVAGNEAWRARLLLLLWPLCLLAVTVRHSTPIYPQYVYVLDPVAYLTIGVAAMDLLALLGDSARHERSSGDHTRRWQWAIRRPVLRAAATIPVAVVSAITASQLVVTSVFIFVLASGTGWGWSWSGIPILSYTSTLSSTAQLASKLHARRVYIIADPGDPYMGLYWAQRQNNLGNGAVTWSSYVAQDCVIAPPGGAPGIVLSLTNQGLALQQLLHEGGMRLLQKVPMARGTTYDLYALAQDPSTSPAQTTLNGEIALNSAVIAAAGSGMPARLLTTWTVLESSTSTSSVAQYHFHFLFRQGAHTFDVWSSCAPQTWLAGERLTVVTALPAGLDPARRLAPRVIVTRDTHIWYRPSFGPLELDTAKELPVGSVMLPPGTTRGSGIAHPNQATLNRCTVSIVLAGSNGATVP
jgi:hypothetical protein